MFRQVVFSFPNRFIFTFLEENFFPVYIAYVFLQSPLINSVLVNE